MPKQLTKQLTKQLWLKDDRQRMNNSHYEFFHNFTDRPAASEFHAHDFYEIFFLLSGSVDYLVENRTYPLRPGDIILTNTSELHRAVFRGDKPCERYVAWIHPGFMERCCAFFHTDIAVCFDSSSQMHYNLLKADSDTLAEIRGLFERLLEGRDTGADAGAGADTDVSADTDAGTGTFARAWNDCHTAELLLLLNQVHANTTVTPGIHVITSEKVSDILYYINQHLAEPLTLEDIAGHFYLSKYYLTRLFKQYTGLPLHQYIRKKRLITAKNLMLAGSGISSACMNSGFNNYSHFSYCFKQEFALSPTDYLRVWGK